ncbi:MAG: hypothetical protein J6M62_11875 [Selenomonadaceae bacterium]|nr:hypothetical protein [Selenomonadaceae bacterium]
MLLSLLEGVLHIMEIFNDISERDLLLIIIGWCIAKVLDGSLHILTETVKGFFSKPRKNKRSRKKR